MREPNIATEVFLSLVKWFLIFVIINNLIWAGVYFFSGSSVELGQADSALSKACYYDSKHDGSDDRTY